MLCNNSRLLHSTVKKNGRLVARFWGADHTQPPVGHQVMKLVVLDSVVQRVLHKSRSVWVLNNTRHSVYIPKDSQPRQVQTYYQKQDTWGAVTCLWEGRGKWHNPLWRMEVEISPSPHKHVTVPPYYCALWWSEESRVVPWLETLHQP